MPNAFTKSIGAKRTRQYEAIKKSAVKSGKSAKVAKRIAAASVNKARSKAGDTKKRR